MHMKQFLNIISEKQLENFFREISCNAIEDYDFELTAVRIICRRIGSGESIKNIFLVKMKLTLTLK